MQDPQNGVGQELQAKDANKWIIGCIKLPYPLIKAHPKNHKHQNRDMRASYLTQNTIACKTLFNRVNEM